MEPLSIRYTSTILISLLIIVLSGCAGKSPASRYYLLSSMIESVDLPDEADDPKALKIGVGPIYLPAYLDRTQMVVRTGGHEAKLAQFDRWAEPLAANFSRVITENLAYLLNTVYLHTYPWSNRIAIDYQVSIHVFRFDAIPEKQAELVANWRVLSGTDRSILIQKRSHIRREVESSEVSQSVAALNATLEALCREMAQTIQSLHRMR